MRRRLSVCEVLHCETERFRGCRETSILVAAELRGLSQDKILPAHRLALTVYMLLTQPTTSVGLRGFTPIMTITDVLAQTASPPY
jgi:hypothetical protein